MSGADENFAVVASKQTMEEVMLLKCASTLIVGVPTREDKLVDGGAGRKSRVGDSLKPWLWE